MFNQRKVLKFEAIPYRPIELDPNYADRTWKIIEHGINEIYNHNDNKLSHEELYRVAYDMVLNRFGARLYNGLVVTVTRHLEETRKSIESAQGSFLDELNRKWTDHTEFMQKIREILLIMDYVSIPFHHKTPIKELGLNLWRDHIIHSAKIQTRLVDSLLEKIHKERMGEVINHELTRNVMKMLTELGVYQEVLEIITRSFNNDIAFQDVLVNSFKSLAL
ncbi:Cullin-3B [Carex littledalei]|uniref:Cullin-3B n=1 Tax=Carex littledalei TaxID=544730 RepID=A0A833RIG1_9POAL|nr:Cullin-3B [Carex littledalei]